MLHFLQKFKVGALVLFALILTVMLTALVFPRYERVHWYRQLVITVITPPKMLLTSTRHFVTDTWDHYIAISDAARENEELKKKLDETNRRLTEFAGVQAENQRLQNVLKMADELKLTGIGAYVISSNPLAELRAVTIDRGYNDGVQKNMIVISHGGLVGKIARVSNSEATVLLISDPNSMVDVIVQRAGIRALLNGTYNKTELRPFFSLSRLEYLNRVSDVKNGDDVITSGLDRLYPKNIPVGTVKNVASTSTGIFKDAEVVPFVDFASIREVMVVR